MKFELADAQPTSTYQDPGCSQGYRIIRLIDELGGNAEVLVKADFEALPVLHQQLLQLLAEKFPHHP